MDFGLFAKNRITEETEKIQYKAHFWTRIAGRSAKRFAKRVSQERETPLVTTYNGSEVLVHLERLWLKGEESGSYTATREQQTGAKMTRSYVKGRRMYEQTDAIIKLKE